MYNRYQLPIDEAFEPALPFPRPAPDCMDPPPHPGPPVPPRPPLPLFPDREPEREGLFSSLLRRFHMPRFETDDLLLLAIAWLLLRDSEDEDLLLILAALYLFQ